MDLAQPRASILSLSQGQAKAHTVDKGFTAGTRQISGTTTQNPALELGTLGYE